MHESVAFDSYTRAGDGYGGFAEVWAEQYTCRAEFVYDQGGEAVEAAAVAEQSTFKVRIRSSIGADAIRSSYRMRDVRRGVIYNIREVDNITNRKMVYLVVEAGVAQ